MQKISTLIFCFYNCVANQLKRLYDISAYDIEVRKRTILREVAILKLFFFLCTLRCLKNLSRYHKLFVSFFSLEYNFSIFFVATMGCMRLLFLSFCCIFSFVQ